MDHTLSARERRFVNEFLVDMDQHKAAVRAGYNLVGITGNDLLARRHILASIEGEFERRAIAANMKHDELIRHYCNIARANLIDYTRLNANGEPYFDLEELSHDQWYAVAECTVETYMDGRGDDAREVKKIKFKLHDKIKAMEQLAKLLGFEPSKKVVGQLVTVTANGPQDAATIYQQMLNNAAD